MSAAAIPACGNRVPARTSRGHLAGVGGLLLTLAAMGGCDSESAAGATSAPTAVGNLAALVEEARIDGHKHELVPLYEPSNHALVVLPDGSLAVRQGQDRKIRFFRPDGTPDGSFGQAGEGPGEFVGLGPMGLRGDSLWAYDQRLFRFTLLTPDRRCGRSRVLDMRVHPRAGEEDLIPPAEFSVPHALLPGDTVLRLALPYWETIPEGFGGSRFFAAVDAAGAIQQVLARSEARHQQVSSPSGSSTVVPFANVPIHTVSSDGQRVASATAHPEAPQPYVMVETVGRDGKSIYQRRIAIEPVPLPGAVRDSMYELRSERLKDHELLELIRDRLDETEFYPPLTEMVIGRDGTLWVGLAGQSEAVPYFALAADGAPLGRIELPAGSRVAGGDEESIWVIERDEFDVESLVRYGVTW